MSGTPQYMDVDRLALVDGETYTLHLFYAQRHEGSSVFRLRTNIPLSTEGMVPDITSQYD